MRVIISRSPRSNKDYIFNEIKSKLKERKRVYYLVPDQSSLSSEIDIFNNFQFKSTIDLKVKSFRSIVDEILTKCGGKRLNFLNDQSQKLLIKICLKKLEKDLVTYRKSIRQEGFVDLLIKFIKSAKANKLGPDQLQDFLEDKSLGESLQNKLRDLILIYKEYDRLTKGHLFDGNDKLDYAIKEAKLMDEYRGVSFYIDQFNSMSKQELDLIKEIDKLTDDLTMTLTLDPSLVDLDKNYLSESLIEDGEVFDLSRSFLESIKSLINPEIVINNNPYYKNSDMDRLLKATFSYKKDEKTAHRPISSVYISRYKNTEEECENLAISINRDIFEEKLRFRDIAVVCSNQEEYFERVKRQFKLNDIPYFIDAHRNILENPMAKYLKSSLQLLSSNFSYQDIISYLKYSFFEIERDKLNYFQNYLTERKIIGDMIFDDSYFIQAEEDDIKRKYDDEDKDKLEIVNQVRGVFLDSLSSFMGNYEDLIQKKSTNNRIIDYCKQVYHFISNPQAVIRLSAYENRLESLNKNDIIDENRLVWKNFVTILDSFASLNPDLELSFDDFIGYLDEAIDDIKIGIVPPGQDQVQVGDFERSRFMEVKKLYILGMTNSYFPKSNNSADIFVDSEKEKLISLGFEMNDTSEIYSKRDLFAFYNLLTKAEDIINISYSLIDGANSPMQKAAILSYIESAIDRKNINQLGEDYKNYVYSKSKLAYYLPTRLREIRAEGFIKAEERDFVLATIGEISGRKEYQNIYLSMEMAGKILKKSDRLSNKSIDLAFPDSKSFSVSQLEAYKRCPYNHFISYGIKPRVKNDYNVDLASYGNISHDVFDKFVTSLSREEHKPLDNQELKELVDKDFSKSVEKYVDGYKLEDKKNLYFLDKLNRNLAISCMGIQEQINELNIEKTYTEQEYGRGRKFPPLSVEVAGKTYEMEGKIDRVDSFTLGDKTYYSIIDYKTGRKVFDLNRVYQGLDLQLMVYLYTVIRSGGEAFGAFYMNINHKYIDIDKYMSFSDVLKDKMKLTGLAVDELKLLKGFDKTFKADERPNSMILNLSKSIKDYKKQENLIQKTVFDSLFKRVIYNIEASIQNIKDGDIEVKPYWLSSTSPCSYCRYKSICRFENDNYNFIEAIKTKTLIDMLGEENA